MEDRTLPSPPKLSLPASPGIEMAHFDLELRELLEKLHREVIQRFDKQEDLIRREHRRRPGGLSFARSHSPTSGPQTPTSAPQSPRLAPLREMQEEASEDSRNSRTKPRKSKMSQSTETNTAIKPQRPSYRPLFHTFTQADMALKQRAADVESKRTRRLFQAKSSLEGIEHEEERRSRLQRMIDHPAFDSFFALLVVTNTIFIGIEVQETIANPGVRPTIFFVVQYMYTALFTFELVLRVVAEGLRIFIDEEWMWAWLDLVVVASSLAEVGFNIVEAQVGTDVSGLRAFRVIRITRFLKTLRLVRVFRFVMALRTLITSILYTLRSLFWALVLLALIIYVFSVLLAQAVSDHLADSSALDETLVVSATKYFGSLPHTMLSLFKAISGGVSWEEVLDPLEKISMIWVLVFLFYVAFTYFAVLNVLTGVFCQSAIESAQNDHANVVQSMLANKEAHVEKIRALFSKLGADRDGIITYSMFEEGVNSQAVVEYFETLGLDVWDAWSFFKLLDLDSGGAVEIEEFFKGCLRLRGQARGVDVGKLIHDQSWLIKNQGHFQTYMETKMQQVLAMLSTVTGLRMDDPADAGWVRGTASLSSMLKSHLHIIVGVQAAAQRRRAST
ncbi:putative voltage-dependent R-type calcium channel subunit alpha-1E [Symbiodinium microadriaticum]|uniref:Putative voltage-dependent R-type calcium channel subunit alpha-1E n=1 Tax=Symbiodinium microadriaticum TaxID=2951 RepID=A0A1Q9EN51_SYMMI|nr:putative voltage-dependent R-type calcium channel subunit alpha-1E [Symbiodinium microadriaticum]